MIWMLIAATWLALGYVGGAAVYAYLSKTLPIVYSTEERHQELKVMCPVILGGPISLFSLWLLAGTKTGFCWNWITAPDIRTNREP